ncbi:CHAT domain-containing protein [Amycolatopsis sp. CA-128772]|uniref:CHAT domain-containing protein n=1 Tax=Amycolatopsis sp. CA-128772 TaxID=2073159 RepID=UPI000CD23556|nr:CHAT domain-containing protein [Amycolatopsis sp. CA-128772]
MTGTLEEDAVVLRCQAAVIRAITDGGTESDVADVVAGLSRLRADHPHRARIAAAMLMALFRGNTEAVSEHAAHAGELLRFAEADPPTHPEWARVRTFARMGAMMHAGLQGQLTDLAPLDAELGTLGELAGDNPAIAPALGFLRTMSGLLRALHEGDESVLHRAPAELAGHIDGFRDRPEFAPLLAALEPMVRAFAANQQGDHAGMLRWYDTAARAARDLPGHDTLRQVMADTAIRMEPMRALVGAAPGEGDDLLAADRLAELEAMAERPGAAAFDRAVSHLTLGGAYLRGNRETDAGRVGLAIGHLRKAQALLPPGHPQHAFCLYSVAAGLFRQSELAGNTDGLDEADELLQRARAELDGPQHPHWAAVNDLLGQIRERTGQLQDVEETGLLAQRSYAWRVLLESDAAGAKITIRDAARDAFELARRCLKADNLAAALRALDTGRGLMLFAATELAKVPARLEAAGHAELARRWETEGADSGGLRREVLSVLAGGTGSLLDPPDVGEIRAALSSLAADALVYLVPAEPPLPGLALIAPAGGPLAWMVLPELSVRDDEGVERYLTALAGRSARDLSARDLSAAPDDDALVESFDPLCDWAWGAAMGPLLEGYFGPRAGGPVPRIVLIPMGDLARIPWQAARRGDGVYAVELAELSQAVSAQLLCENAAREPVALSAGGLVVGDPDTGDPELDLDAAGLEAYTVRQAFYRGARYVGRRPNGTVSPSGRGTADEVRRWLADPGPGAGAMLHLACHGSFAAGLEDAEAFLLLAADDPAEAGGELSAEEILELLVAAPERRVGLVVLAACNTGRSVHGYDEAYSLGTAFLTGGVRSVLSTQWSIPDAQTPSLMYLFHHYCRREGLPPRRALRQAQMWMLDPGRVPPAGMPAELLAAVPHGEPAPVAAWAGFLHFGH